MTQNLDASGRGPDALANGRPVVLVVDDGEVERALMRTILESGDFVVREAADGPSGWTEAVLSQPEVVILDINMPGESGIETCRALKESAETAHIPVIFVSSETDVATKVAGFDAGAVDFVTKPFEREEVLARVRIHVRMHRLLHSRVQAMEESLGRVRDAQTALLTDPRAVPGCRAGVFHRSLHEAGGDFYEIIPLGSGVIAYFVADVSGHDVGISLVLSGLKAILHENARLLSGPNETMAALNSFLIRLLAEDQFATACLAVLNRRRGRLTLVNAGHPPFLLARGGRVDRAIIPPSDVLGKFTQAVFRRLELPVATGERLFLYTDGCIERASALSEAGMSALARACEAESRTPIGECASKVMERLFPGGAGAEDDQLLLGVEV